MPLMIYLTLIMIFNFNINVFFNYYNLIAIILIICNVGSLSEYITNILMLKCHCISLVFVLSNRPDDGLVNKSKTGSLLIWLRMLVVLKFYYYLNLNAFCKHKGHYMMDRKSHAIQYNSDQPHLIKHTATLSLEWSTQ